MLQQEVHAPIEVLDLDLILGWKENVFGGPFLHGQLGSGGEGPVRHHCKQGSLHWCCKRAILEGPFQAFSNVQAIPQAFEEMDAACRLAVDKTKITGSLTLGFQGIFWVDKAAQAANE